jgi:hypothetical protein
VPDALRRGLDDAEGDGGSGIVHAICSERIPRWRRPRGKAG